MNKYQEKYETKNPKMYLFEIKQDLKSQEKLSFEDLYWCAKLLYVYNESDEDVDTLTIESIRTAFRKGLNIENNRELYLDASIILSRLYFKYKKYELAINYLMYLVELQKEIPDWIHAFYAYAQVLSDEHFLYISSYPKHFFARLEQISSEKTQKRNEVFLSFVNKIKENLDLDENFEYAKEELEKEVEKFNLKKEYNEIFNQAKDFEEEFELVLSQKNETIKALNEEIEELKKSSVNANDEYKKLCEENTKLKNKVEELELKILSLRNENTTLRKNLQDELNNNQNKQKYSIQAEIEEYEEENASIEDFRDGHKMLRDSCTNHKILVLGNLPGKINSYTKRYRKRGFEEKDFDFVSYEDVTNRVGQITYQNYAAVICGAVPHMASDIEDCSSVIQAIENSGALLFVSRANSNSRELKMSDGKFSKFLDDIIRHYSILFN